MIRLGVKLLNLFFFLIPALLSAQKDSVRMVKFTPEFRFEDGIYLYFEQVKKNDPIPTARLMTNAAYDDREFFEYMLKSKEIAYYDALGMRQTINVEDLWGFSRKGILYIRLDDSFHRITIVGQICHFVATVTTYDTRYYDPYYYNPYNYYNYRYGMYPPTTASSEVRQYLLNFQTGDVYDYTFENLEILLMQDPDLHDEFSQLRKKRKKQRKFLYLRRFNERNPLYIPVKQKFNP